MMRRSRPRWASIQVPEEVNRKIVERIIAEKGNETYQRRSTEDLAVWNPEQLRSLGSKDQRA